jgi:hypothetical protein
MKYEVANMKNDHARHLCLAWPFSYILIGLSLLEGCFTHAGNLALVCKLSEADTADAVVAEICMGTAADLAAVVFAGGELCRCLLLENH